jgi:DNA-binding NtrC family response regulator
MAPGPADNCRASRPMRNAKVKKLASALVARLQELRIMSGGRSQARSDVARVPVLLAADGELDRLSIDRLLSGTRYLVVPAADAKQAARLLSQVVFPIALYDCRDAAEWQMCVRPAPGHWHAPSIVLLANEGAKDLCKEPACCGAFDVLVRPFRAEDLVSVLDLAYTKWLTGLEKGRRPCRAMTVPPPA